MCSQCVVFTRHCSAQIFCCKKIKRNNKFIFGIGFLLHFYLFPWFWFPERLSDRRNIWSVPDFYFCLGDLPFTECDLHHCGWSMWHCPANGLLVWHASQAEAESVQLIIRYQILSVGSLLRVAANNKSNQPLIGWVWSNEETFRTIIRLLRAKLWRSKTNWRLFRMCSIQCLNI